MSELSSRFIRTSLPIVNRDSTMFMTRASFKIEVTSDTHIVISDMNDGRSLANDIISVIARLNQHLQGGIGNRRVYYRATDGHFNEILLKHGEFSGITACTEGQQQRLAAMLDVIHT